MSHHCTSEKKHPGCTTDTQACLRFYAFDCLVLHSENIMSKSLEKRFGVS